MLYVNNIRSYYNILKWLTANEEPPEGEIQDDTVPPPPDLPQSGEPVEAA